MFNEIDQSILPIKILLESNYPISFDEFRVMMGVFSADLRALLNTFFDFPKKQVMMAPHINYYRQLQHFFVFILRFPSILDIPHHSEFSKLWN